MTPGSRDALLYVPGHRNALQALKDKWFEHFQAEARWDHDTGCCIYHAKNQNKGVGYVSIFGEDFRAALVAYWVFHRFDLWDESLRLVRKKCCQFKSCIATGHYRLVRAVVESQEGGRLAA